MNNVKLSEHKKVGDTLHTPFTGSFGQQMQLTSWSRDKLPQYIWIALILDALGREIGLNTLGQIMQDLNKQEICIAELSKVLSLEDKKQRTWYDIINSYIPKRVLAPLSVVFPSRLCTCFLGGHKRVFDASLRKSCSPLSCYPRLYI